jgi:predicted nucleic acid-binding protein
MNMITVYIESHFVLELALLQEQYQSCEQILSLCESGKARLVLPTFCLAKPYEAFVRRSNTKKGLRQEMRVELQQLSRAAVLPKNRVDVLENFVANLVQTNEAEAQRLHQTLDRILKKCEVISMVPEVLSLAVKFRGKPLELSIQESIVCASVVHHLGSQTAGQKCFLTGNPRDFNKPDIQATFESHNCQLFFDFEKGYNYLQTQLAL